MSEWLYLVTLGFVCAAQFLLCMWSIQLTRRLDRLEAQAEQLRRAHDGLVGLHMPLPPTRDSDHLLE